ncbi:MAG: PEP-CTERM sorting domain-containing protein, partial [candidate division Zixibacteria bacterium]|nr:PEP-CTERM sorting domain-containing protein [candidate division Zixibacteria bacterium]
AAQGVLFQGVNGSAPIITMDGSLQVLSPNPPYAGDFAAFFTNAVDWVEFDAGYWNDRYTGIIELYDENINYLASFTNQFTYLELGYNYEHFSFHGYGPIGAVYFHSSNDLAGAAMDNLDFSAPIPEPATIALVGLGLLGLGARLRKRS